MKKPLLLSSRGKVSEDNEKVIITDGETLYDTSESLSVEENGGKPTIEVFADNGEDIINNTTR
jgi:hypothetical protein